MSAPAPSACSAVTTAAALAVDSKRHDRDEPNAANAAVSSSSSSNSAAAADSTRPAPIARLYRHVLECILAFSDAKTLAAALRVSKEWLAAVGSMRALAFKVEYGSLPAESAAAPAMGRHVSDFRVDFQAQNRAGGQGSLARLLPHLRRLRCWVPEWLGAAVLFPAGLRELSLATMSFATTTADINAALVAAGRLERLELLTLAFRHMDPLISFAPLAALPLLRALVLHGPSGSHFSGAHLTELRALPRLHSLHVAPISTSALRRLLAQPHNLQWQKISLPYPLKPDDAALLPQLPSLTELNLDAEFLVNFDCLLQLPNLASLQCSFGFSDEPLADRLAAALRHCAGLVELTLFFCRGLSAAHLADMLPRLPQLQELELSALEIDSLSFLAQPPMTSQLRSLSLKSCIQLAAAELRHLHSLRGLRELEIESSFDEQMQADGDELTALRPPSAALPLLRSFSFSARCFEAESDY